MNPVYIFPHHFFKIHFNIILSPTSKFSDIPTNCSFLKFLMSCKPHSSRFEYTNNITEKSTNYELRHYVIFPIMLPNTQSYVSRIITQGVQTILTTCSLHCRSSSESEILKLLQGKSPQEASSLLLSVNRITGN